MGSVGDTGCWVQAGVALASQIRHGGASLVWSTTGHGPGAQKVADRATHSLQDSGVHQRDSNGLRFTMQETRFPT